MFSVLLFGTSGVVLDFGRVYSEHSIMQSYTDQAALAAAAELDREPDSIDRAVNAVFGGLDAEGNDIGAPLTKPAVFSSGADNQFNISHLVFLSDLANDAGAQSSMTGIQSDIVYVAFADGGSNGNQSTAALEAKYVIAVAEERSVSNTLISLINSGAETAAASSNVVRTVAAARREVSFCGEFSNLVMCSPRTAMSGNNAAADNETNLGDFLGYFQGARFAHVADGAAGAEHYRLYRRRNPAIGAEDRGGLVSVSGVETICNTLGSIPGNPSGSDTDQLARYQAICHLAAAKQRDHCVGETLEIVSAEPEVITTALNVAFNMWDQPINEVIRDWPSNGGLTSMPLFQPDRLTMKGKVWETDDSIREITNNTFGLNGNEASRLHYKSVEVGEGPESQLSSTLFDLILPDCLRTSATMAQCGVPGESLPGLGPFIGHPANLTQLTNFYEYNYPVHFFKVGGQTVPGNVFDFYDMYLEERSGWTHASQQITTTTFIPPFTFNTTVDAEAGESLAVSGEDASLAAYTPSPDLTFQTGDLYEDNPTGLQIGYPANLVSPDDNLTRRRFSVPLVDCSTMSSPDDDGVFEADILEFVDMYLLQPPRVECGVPGNDQCNNADITSATVMTEFVSKSDYIQNTFPELVR